MIVLVGCCWGETSESRRRRLGEKGRSAVVVVES
jgi:hypothetical protein